MKGHTLINGFDHLYHSVIITLKNYPLQTHFICDANSNACLAAKNSTSFTVDGNGMLALSAAIGCPLESLSTTPIPALPDSLKTAPLKFALIYSPSGCTSRLYPTGTQLHRVNSHGEAYQIIIHSSKRIDWLQLYISTSKMSCDNWDIKVTFGPKTRTKNTLWVFNRFSMNSFQ